VLFPWQNKTLLSLYNRLYETGSGLSSIKKELVNFQNKPLTGNASIALIREDHFGNLYLITINEGFTKVLRNNFPIKYYGTAAKEDNYVLSILPDKKRNRILAGTYGNGLLVFDTLQRLVKHFKTLPGRPIGFSINTILKNSKGEYILFVMGEKDAWKVSGDLSAMNAIRMVSATRETVLGISYFGNFLFQNEREAVTQSHNKFYRTNFSASTVAEYAFAKTTTMSGILYHNSILTHTYNELIMTIRN
jgi:hypothetical protein